MTEGDYAALAACYAEALVTVRARARDLGYAIGLHGSQTRDLDLIAAPWTDEAVSADVLAEEIRRAVDGLIAGTATTKPEKPHGRRAYSIILKHGPPNERTGLPFIDLSVMPRSGDAP